VKVDAPAVAAAAHVVAVAAARVPAKTKTIKYSTNKKDRLIGLFC
jgi:hypothetical protein